MAFAPKIQTDATFATFTAWPIQQAQQIERASACADTHPSNMRPCLLVCKLADLLHYCAVKATQQPGLPDWVFWCRWFLLRLLVP